MKVVGLLSDFSSLDPFVAEMKAVLLSICPEVRIVDITHQVKKFDIRMGAFLLASTAPYFPVGTVHVAVVDPGVGGKRRAIALESKRAVYVGPDNGLLIPAAARDGILHAYELTNRSLMREPVSATFHGRDIFAPIAAHLACGTSVTACGPEISDYVRPRYSEPEFKGMAARCEVFHIDSFGNIITNLTREHLPRLGFKVGDKVSLRVGQRSLRARFVQTFSDLLAGEFGFLVGSHDFLEIACRETSAARKLHVRNGTVVLVAIPH